MKYVQIKWNFNQTHMALRDPKAKEMVHVNEKIKENPFNLTEHPREPSTTDVE